MLVDFIFSGRRSVEVAMKVGAGRIRWLFEVGYALIYGPLALLSLMHIRELVSITGLDDAIK